MRAIVWQGPQNMTVEEVDEPTAEPGTVVLSSDACGICGSEIEGYLGRMGNRVPPLVMGHEFAGTVAAVGEGVDPALEGQVVAVNPLRTCGECRPCLSGQPNLCPGRTLIGIQYPGAFAEKVGVPAANVYPLPEGVDPRLGALAEPLANGIHAVGQGLEVTEAETALIVGGGTIGMMCLQAAVFSGIPHVALVEPHEGRQRKARKLGAHSTHESIQAAEAEITSANGGFGPDLVVDAVGSAQTRSQGARAVRPGGVVVLIGLHEDDSTLGFHDLIRGQVTLRGSFTYTADDFDKAVGWLVSGGAGLEELTPPRPLEEGPEIFSELIKGPTEELKVFLGGGIRG